MKTIQDVQFLYEGVTGSFTYHTDGAPVPTTKTLVTVPAGTPTTHQTACGYDEKYNFVAYYGWAPAYIQHDLKYHGANVPAEFVK